MQCFGTLTTTQRFCLTREYGRTGGRHRSMQRLMSSALRQQACVNVAVLHRWLHQRSQAASAILSGSRVQLDTSLYPTHRVTTQKTRMFASRLPVQLFTVTCQCNSVSSQKQFNSFRGSSYVLIDRRTFMANVKRLDYTECHRRKGPNFGRVFLMLNYTDITQNTYIQS